MLALSLSNAPKAGNDDYQISFFLHLKNFILSKMTEGNAHHDGRRHGRKFDTWLLLGKINHFS